jgi:hypothetical protein
MCSNLAPISSTFYGYAQDAFYQVPCTELLCRPDFINKLCMHVMLETVCPVNLRRNFLRHFLAQPHLNTIRTENALFNSIPNNIHTHTHTITQ